MFASPLKICTLLLAETLERITKMTVHKHHAHGHRAAGATQPTPAPTPAYIRGIDVSHHNIVDAFHHHKHHIVKPIDWGKVKADGYTFAFTKSSEGMGTDWTFSTNWAAMKSAGLLRGAFHFGRPGKDAVKQAKWFHKIVQPASGDLLLALDLEVTDGKSPTQVWDWAKAFLDEIQSLTGQPAIFYSYGPFIMKEMGNPTDNRNCPLWLAAYVHNPAKYVPRAWKDWTIWQWGQMKHLICSRKKTKNYPSNR
jgi:lysozyme